MTTKEPGNDSVHDFIVSLEAKAKRILKEADKKRREDLRLEHVKQFASGLKSKTKNENKMAQNGSVLIPLLDTSTIHSTTKILDKMDLKTTLENKTRNMKTQLLSYSVPKLSVSLTDTVDLDDLASSGKIRPFSGTKLNPLVRTYSEDTLTKTNCSTENLSKKKLLQSQTFDKSFLFTSKSDPTKSNSNIIPPKENKTLKKLDQSPFISGESNNLNEFLNTGKMREKKEINLLMESSWSIKSQATDILSGKQASNAARVQAQQTKLAAVKKKSKLKEEPQGPIDWNIRGLRSKYRGETERENLYQSWVSANGYAADAVDDGGLILSVATVHRHPLYVLYNRIVEEENFKSFKRTRNRLRMKRFVLDIQEIWLTNLQHLREHQPHRLLAEHTEPVGMDAGLAGRRDSAAIRAMESQIQSVSEKRALQHAFFSTIQEEPSVVLDYKPGPTPKLQPSKPLPPVLEILIDGLTITPRDSSGRPFSQQQTHILFVDRLLPSMQSSNRQVLWRISVMEKRNVAMGYLYTTEIDVERFLDISRIELPISDARPTPTLAHRAQHVLPWSIMDLPADNFHKIMVRISTRLGVEFNHLVLELETNVAELQALYPEFCSGVDALDDFEWWAGPKSLEIWQNVFTACSIQEDEYNDEGDPYPCSLFLTRKHTVATSVSEARPTTTAYSNAFDLTRFITISSYKLNESDEKSFLKINITSSSGDLIPIHNEYEEKWEIVSDDGPSLSMRTQGAITRNAQVPGSCEYGKLGLWFTYKNDTERTQPAASFFRDAELSSTDAVLVNLSLALDTPLLVPCALAWEAFTEAPTKAPGEPVDGVIPMLASQPQAIIKESLISPLTERVSFQCAIFNTAPISSIDHISLDSVSLPAGLQRHWPMRNKYGFRRKLIHNLLDVDIVLPTIVYGITRSGAIANQPGVTQRNIWHNILAVVEHINRPRTAKDYAYVISCGDTRGANNPNAFSVIMKGGEFFDLFCQFFAKYEEEYAEINERKSIFARQVALDQKIEISEIALRTRERLLEKQIMKEKQKAIEKKLRKASKSERGWNRRFKMSALVEIQKNWEKRKDYYSGAYFFHAIQPSNNLSFSVGEDDMSVGSPGSINQHEKINKKKKIKEEKFLLTCQWHVPSTWDGDPLSDIGAPSYAGNFKTSGGNRGGFNDSISDAGSISLAGDSEMGYVHLDNTNSSAFQEPKDTWIPGGDFSTFDEEKTPGIKSAAVLARPTKESDRLDLMDGGKAGNSVTFASLDLHSKTTQLAEKSWESKGTINTENMEQIAEQLVKSDELIRILAKRLGLPVEKLVPLDEMTSVFSSVGQDNHSEQEFHTFDVRTKQMIPLGKGQGFPAPRDAFEEDIEDPEFDEDDDLWSDDEFAAGDHDEDDIGDLPQNHEDVLKLKLKGLKEGKTANSSMSSVPANVPYLDLKGKSIVKENDSDTQATGWRRLARPEINATFYAKLLLRRTIGPDASTSNKTNNCIYLLPISPVDACDYQPAAFEAPIESIFIPNAKKDMERAIATLARNIAREQDLAKNVATDDLILFGEAKESTSADLLIAAQYHQDQHAFIDPTDAAIEKAIQAAKASNIAEMEDALEEDIPVNSIDQFGNTLLLLAAQQGSKRMCKFLLRKGANINSQNLGGNTVLHFCFTYSHKELAEYLLARGADDSILNADGMTCYEGLSSDALDNPYDF